MSIGLVTGAIWRQHYPPGVRHEIEIPNKSLADLFVQACEKHGEKTGAIFLDTNYSFSYLGSEVSRFASALAGLGISKGRVVALLLPNSIQFIISYYGTLRTGASVAPINPLSTSREIEYQALKSVADVIVILDIFYSKVAEAMPATSIKHVIVTNIADYLPRTRRTLGKMLKKIPSATVPKRPEIHSFRKLIDRALKAPPHPSIDPESDVATLQFTGGTTGRPKAVPLTHRNIIANIMQMAEMINPYITLGEEIFAALLPFYHIYGQTVILGAGLTQGNTLLIFPRLELERFIRDLSRYGVTVFPAVPTLLNMMSKSAITKQVDLSKLKLVISGADFLPAEVAREFEDVTGKKVLQGYGLTEASPVTHFNPPDKIRANSVGIPIPSTLAGIVNPSTHEFLPPGSAGELVVSGPQVMRGYLEGGEDVIFEAYGRRWLKTGDICLMDSDGYFYFVERAKDIIKHKGFTVYPAEIENVLMESGVVKEAAVVGVPDRDVGESIVAVVVPNQAVAAENIVEKLKRLCETRLAEFKRPARIIVVDELPKSPVGKILRRSVRERFMA
ncbi:MAG: AMP-binding protein [Nitrososphaerota archaeon]